MQGMLSLALTGFPVCFLQRSTARFLDLSIMSMVPFVSN